MLAKACFGVGEYLDEPMVQLFLDSHYLALGPALRHKGQYALLNSLDESYCIPILRVSEAALDLIEVPFNANFPKFET